MRNKFTVLPAIIFTLFLIQAGSFAQDHDQVTGIVFHDLNTNGILDENEPGIADVVVSNQLEAVKTDSRGRYSLPATDRTIIFVSKPSAFTVPLDENNLPQFYYIHQPGGSPEGLDYTGISPTGDLPESLDFALISSEQKDEFNVIVTGDPQPYTAEQVNYYLNDIVTEMLSYDADFYLALGDLVDDDLNLYDQLNEGVRHLELPAYNVIGNHDMNLKAKSNSFKAETFRTVFGPDYYSFNKGQVHFLVLNSIQYEGWNKKEDTQGRYFGGFDYKQLEWMANDLKFVPDDHLLVLITHIPILDGPMKKETIEKVFDILKNRKHLLALAGHQHKIVNGNYGEKEHWTQPVHFPYLVAGAACGSWWSKVKDERGIPLAVAQDGTPNGFFVFNFKDNTYSFKFHP
ncbi:MAG: metallophosphoesterase, partial [Bacteroidetes bacterium]|nr:metallophosphoesterase [Bacteroidota bacterium]